MNEQKVSLGRIVIVRNSRQSNGASEHPAIVNRCWDNNMVNVTVFPDCGEPYAETSINEIDPTSNASHGWFWPPRV